MDMGDTLEERILRHAPELAAGYYLEFHPRGGNVVRYPKVGAFGLNPFCASTGTPFGTYNLYFVRHPTDTRPLPAMDAANPYPRVQIPSAKKSTLDRAIHEFQGAASPREDASSVEKSDDEAPLTLPERMTDLDVAIASTPAMITARADVEKQRMTMELAENNQELLINGNFSRNAAEALALNRAYRRESQVVFETQADLVRRTAVDMQSHWQAFRMAQEAQLDGVRLLKEQLDMFPKPAPPPPPQPDYSPAIVEGLKTLRDFGIALIQAKAGPPTAPPTPTEAPRRPRDVEDVLAMMNPEMLEGLLEGLRNRMKG